MVGLCRAGVNADWEILDMHNSPQEVVRKKGNRRVGEIERREGRKDGGRRKRKMSSASQAASASTVRR